MFRGVAMEETLKEIVKAIEKLSEKDIIDYLLVIVPILVSIVAIFISIATARKQNKIALFERRYNCFFQIKTVLAFSKAIETPYDRKVIVALFDSFWGTNIAFLSGDKQLVLAMSQVEIIKKDIEQATFLFKHEFNVPPTNIIDHLQSVIIDSILDKSIENDRNKLLSMCKEFEEKDLKHIQKFVKF